MNPNRFLSFGASSGNGQSAGGGGGSGNFLFDIIRVSRKTFLTRCIKTQTCET